MFVVIGEKLSRLDLNGGYMGNIYTLYVSLYGTTKKMGKLILDTWQ